MKKCNNCSVNKELNCFSIRKGTLKYRNKCKECAKEYNQKYSLKNREKIAQKRKIYVEKNKGHLTKYKQKYYIKNKERDCKSRKEYVEKNKESKQEYDKVYNLKNREKISNRNKTWKLNNSGKVRHYNAKRKVLKKQATLLSFDKEIKDIYINCPKDYHVDHIIPLNNPIVCGLHVPWNLQYLTPEDNLRKGNSII